MSDGPWQRVRSPAVTEGGNRPTEREDRRFVLRRGQTAARAYEDELVVLDLRSSTYLAANAAATILWRKLTEGATREQLIGALVEEFEVDQERVGPDVDAFIAELRRRELLEDQ